jgi:tRNA(adenine34) deaminase
MINMENDFYYMKQAISRAKAAAKVGEVPIGAVLVKDGKVISSGRNMREGKKNALLHAELVAIDRGCKALGAWRLEDCTLYVTMEPYPMCAGAIINSRIKRVVFGCYDKKAGVYGSVMDLQEYPFNHYYDVEGGVMEAECAKLLSDFFAALRVKKQAEKAAKKSEMNLL